MRAYKQTSERASERAFVRARVHVYERVFR